MTENKELLFNLIKKLESGEITFEKQGNEYFFYIKSGRLEILSLVRKDPAQLMLSEDIFQVGDSFIRRFK